MQAKFAFFTFLGSFAASAAAFLASTSRFFANTLYFASKSAGDVGKFLGSLKTKIQTDAYHWWIE